MPEPKKSGVCQVCGDFILDEELAGKESNAGMGITHITVSFSGDKGDLKSSKTECEKVQWTHCRKCQPQMNYETEIVDAAQNNDIIRIERGLTERGE